MSVAATSSSSLMSSPGVGSGLDVKSIVSQLMAIEQQRMTQLQTKASDITVQLSAFGEVQSKLSAFQSAAATLASPLSWRQSTATPSDTTAMTTTTTGSPANGVYAVAVSQLAQAQSVASTAYAKNTTVVGSGTLHIDLGSWPPATTPPTDPPLAFTPKTDSAGAVVPGIDIAIKANSTLADVRDQINTAKAGISASIVQDASGARLVISSSTTGAASGFKITAPTDTDGGLANLVYDPSTAASPMQQTQEARNALATINGLAVSSATNTFASVIDGVSFTALKTTTTPTSLTVASNTAALQANVQAFVTAYNDVASTLATDTAYDADTKTAGVLQGNGTAVTLRNQFRNLIQQPGGSSSTFKRLSDLGLSLQKDGTLSIDNTKLTNALSQPAEMALAFVSDSAAPAAQLGLGNRFKAFSDAMIGTDGVITGQSSGLQSRLNSNKNDQADEQTREDAMQARLTAQYSALDTQMASLTSLSSYMTQQITAWNKSTG